jgi:hypothetical protein
VSRAGSRSARILDWMRECLAYPTKGNQSMLPTGTSSCDLPQSEPKSLPEEDEGESAAAFAAKGNIQMWMT